MPGGKREVASGKKYTYTGHPSFNLRPGIYDIAVRYADVPSGQNEAIWRRGVRVEGDRATVVQAESQD